jgi:hypothetical protein
VFGLLYGQFGISPFITFAEVAKELQLLHDNPNNWGTQSFTNWTTFQQIRQEYRL